MSAGQNGTLRSLKYRNWHLKICVCTSGLQLWSWDVHGRAPFVFPPCLRRLYLSAHSGGGGKEQSAMLCSWAPVLLPAPSDSGAGERSPPPPPSAPFHSGGCHSCLAGRIAKTIRCPAASRECQQHSGQLENIHPPSLCTATQSAGFTAPGFCLVPCSPGRSHTHKYHRTQGATESC